MEAVRNSGEPSASNGSLARERRAIGSDGQSCARLRRSSREVDANRPAVPPRTERMSRGTIVPTRAAATIGRRYGGISMEYKRSTSAFGSHGGIQAGFPASRFRREVDSEYGRGREAASTRQGRHPRVRPGSRAMTPR